MAFRDFLTWPQKEPPQRDIYCKKSSTTRSIFSFLVTWSKRISFPSSAARRAGAETPVTVWSCPMRSTLFFTGFSPMAVRTLSQNL